MGVYDTGRGAQTFERKLQQNEIEKKHYIFISFCINVACSKEEEKKEASTL